MRIYSIDNVVYGLLYKFERTILSILFKTNELNKTSKIHLFNREYKKCCYFIWNSLYDNFKEHRKLVYELISGNLKNMITKNGRKG